MQSALNLCIIIVFKPLYSVPRVGLKIKYKEMKLEWLPIQPVLNTKTVVQQDSVKALHNNRNALK